MSSWVNGVLCVPSPAFCLRLGILGVNMFLGAWMSNHQHPLPRGVGHFFGGGGGGGCARRIFLLLFPFGWVAGRSSWGMGVQQPHCWVPGFSGWVGIPLPLLSPGSTDCTTCTARAQVTPTPLSLLSAANPHNRAPTSSDCCNMAAAKMTGAHCFCMFGAVHCGGVAVRAAAILLRTAVQDIP